MPTKIRGLSWMDKINRLTKTHAAVDSPAYRSGQRARRDGCYRALACPESDQELIDWLAGWDAADAELRCQS